MSAGTVVMVLGIMAYSIARQIAGEPLRVKRLLGLPTALTVIGIVDVAKTKAPALTHTDIALIAAGVVVNVVIGIGQGRLMRLESRDGYLWGQMPVRVLWWWGAKIASGVVLDGIGHALSAGLATASAVILLRLGVNRLAQAAVVAPRALATGIPFAPEADKAGHEHRKGSPAQHNDLLAEFRQRAATILDDRQTPANGAAPTARRSHTASTGGVPSPSDPAPGLKRQLADLLLREIANRLDGTAK